jgi:hypothetical protein
LSLLKANSVQIGQSATATNNFTLAVPSSPDGTIKLARGNSGATTADILTVANDGRLSFVKPPIGSILQVVQAAKTNLFSTTSTSFTDITDMSASITPSSASSKIMIFVNLKGQSSNNATSRLVRVLLGVDTPIFVGTTATGTQVASSGGDFLGTGSPGGAGQGHTHIFLDSPSTTSSVTYKVQALSRTGGTLFVNSTYNNVDADYVFKGASSLTLMEVAA